MNNQQTFSSDICILVPFCGKFTNDIFKSSQPQKNEIAEHLIDSLTDFSNYECNNQVAKNIERKFLGEYNFACMNDDYENVECSEKALLFISSNRTIDLTMLYIYIPNNQYSPTFIGDHVSADEIYLSTNNTKSTEKNKSKYTHIDSLVEALTGLTRCGDAKIIMFIPKLPDDNNEFQYMLAGEAYNSVHFNYLLKSKEIESIAYNSFKQYDYYDSYASEKSVVFISENFSTNSKENIDIEMSAMYIVELIMLQNAAILRASDKIINALTQNKKTSYAEIENLYTEFGKTIHLWETSNYKYLPAQNFANAIYKAFKTEELLDNYYRYQNHLERIVEISSLRSSERKSSALNFFLTALAIFEFIPLIFDGYSYFSSKNLEDLFITGSSIISLIIIAVIFLVLRYKKRHT